MFAIVRSGMGSGDCKGVWVGHEGRGAPTGHPGLGERKYCLEDRSILNAEFSLIIEPMLGGEETSRLPAALRVPPHGPDGWRSSQMTTDLAVNQTVILQIRSSSTLVNPALPRPQLNLHFSLLLWSLCCCVPPACLPVEDIIWQSAGRFGHFGTQTRPALLNLRLCSLCSGCSSLSSDREEMKENAARAGQGSWSCGVQTRGWEELRRPPLACEPSEGGGDARLMIAWHHWLQAERAWRFAVFVLWKHVLGWETAIIIQPPPSEQENIKGWEQGEVTDVLK